MQFCSLFHNIHWIPVIVMTILSFVLGFAWHQPFLFGKLWTEENKANLGKKMVVPMMFGGTAVMHFIALAALSAVVAGSGMLNGFLSGLLISILWILPAMSGTYLFANRSLKLLAIDFGMYLVLFSISGLILGIW